uniref:ARAD1C35508p n=1 Tax=Blastobotrys adeninivorans TaxID=409370 RepID=A0A060T961_BLAAD
MPILGHLGPKPRQGNSKEPKEPKDNTKESKDKSKNSSRPEFLSHSRHESSFNLSIPRPKLSKKYHSSPLTPTVKSVNNPSSHGGWSHSGSMLGLNNLTRPQGSRGHSPLPSRNHSPPAPPPNVKLSFEVESAPLVLYGTRSESTGALLSGMFRLEVVERPEKLKSVKLAVVQKLRIHKVPSNSGSNHHNSHIKCPKCEVSTSELARWDVLATELELPKQTHEYPFSHLLPGSLPASTSSQLFSVEYFLTATAVPSDPAISPYSLAHTLNIFRAVIKGADKNSIRVFPPTQLTASVTLPAVIFPNSQFPFELSLDGVSLSANNVNNGRTRWRMRKVNWRVEETMKVRPNHCSTHNPNGDKALIVETRTIGQGEVKSGWKTDFSNNGKVELGDCNLTTQSAGVACNVDDPTLGITVSHVLIVELVVAEETVTQKNTTRAAIPTGAARVLRMQFNMVITERSGLGISWDDEVPPTYEDVPHSPPDYHKAVGSPVSTPGPLENIEGLLGVSPSATPAPTEGISERLEFSL